MKTPFDAMQFVFDLVYNSDLQAEISGDVYLMRRPEGSILEDIVVGSGSILGDQIQQGLCNVNIYTPVMPIVVNGKNLKNQPDIDRMKYLASIAEVVLKENRDTDDSQQAFINSMSMMEDGDGKFFINIRINYLGFNIT